ncbi:hypothetical protein DFH08DRAFT_999955 [Mycena albidolilacea]|uniref:Rhodanese domain-containing protein n=1 Tax=Mycena albidolilacea TaxID=1033008 RepID=A0AAD7A2J6_9AGAR|nr:hypothetical protein DFH08DRAFT_999955 [Mycena albidolilacea]
MNMIRQIHIHIIFWPALFESDGVEIYANLLPAANVKSLPGNVDADATMIALNMLLRAVESEEITENTKRIIGASLFGGPAQVNQDDVDGGIRASITDGAKEGCYNPSQYTSGRNPEAHIRWTGPQLHGQLPDMSVFVAGLGTAVLCRLRSSTSCTIFIGDMTRTQPKSRVFTAPGDKDVIDEAEAATSLDSYQASLELCRPGLLVGPSSGLASTGLYHFLQKAKANGGLDRLRGTDGKIKYEFSPGAFICCDQPFQYIGEYFDKIPASLFPKIINDELLGVDQYPYGSSWTISPGEAYSKIQAPASDRTIILDLRDSADFDTVRITGSINLDLQCREEPNPFTSPSVLRRQWLELDRRLDVVDQEFGPNGHTAIMASSVLRKKGVEAYAIRIRFWK